MAGKSVFDDPQYMPVADISDETYDFPSSLDKVPQKSLSGATASKQAGKQQQNCHSDPSHLILSESGDYSTVDDFLEDGQNADSGDSPWDTDFEGDEEEEQDGEHEREGGGRRVGERHRVRVRQSHTNTNGGKLEGSDKIYVDGNLIELKPMVSFKSRVRARSKLELEEDGIYQGLVTTDEQKQQIGIMPESIYMTVALETCRDELENMSLVIEEPPTKPVSQPRSSISPFYRGLILYPPPLPPLNQGAPTTERKCHAIIENVLKSEAAFLTSLKIAEQIYMKPLLEMSNPSIDREQVKVLFGPIIELLAHHELFYSALTQRTMDWGPKQTVGNVFMTFYRREVIAHYVEYVNNFTEAMGTLQRNIKKRQKFVNFLKEKYKESKTSLSLQGLLLKPVQRFPQYILFLQDLIKYTPPHHPDRVALQLALARCETIAEHLNEAKRNKEQSSIVAHLSNRVTQLPFRLNDSPNRYLLMQEPVTRLMMSPQGSGNIVQHKRSLLLFNNMIMCAALAQPKKFTSIVPRDIGPYEDVQYKCKWFSPLDKLTVLEPDYNNDIWDDILREDDTEEARIYKTLKTQFVQHTQDFETLSKIATLVTTLASDYAGLRVVSVQSHMRILQRKIASTKEQLRRKQPGRVDICIPSRDGSKTVHHTYVFESEKAKQNWLNNLRYASLKLKDENKSGWVCAENAEDEDMILDSTNQLPLFVEHHHLTNNSQSLSTECATKTHSNHVWFASCSSTTAEIAIVQSVTPKPIILKSFTVESSRILTICYAPYDGPTSHYSTPHHSSALMNVPILSPHTETIWMGSQTGQLMIHSASSDVAHKCMEVINFSEAITQIEYYNNQMFIAVGGNMYIYKRPKDSVWDLDNPVVMNIHSGEEHITCTCQVQQKLWIGAGNLCYILNMKTNRLEGHFQVTRQANAMVRNMTSSGSGVWISLRRSATIQLFHSVTKSLLQEIDIEKAFRRVTAKYKIEGKLHGLKNVHITSLLLCKGYLWIGTSTGAIMVYRTPYLKTVPITTGKPYMAMQGHSSGVRVLISASTAGSLSSSRFNQFVSEEQERFQNEIFELNESQHHFPTSSNVETSLTSPASEADSYTLPPLPPPVFCDDPTGTLNSVVHDTLSDAARLDAGENTIDSTDTVENEHSTNDATTTSQHTADDDDINLPVRKKSSRWSQKTNDQNRDTSPTSSSLERGENTGTFHRIDTLKAENRGGIISPAFDQEDKTIRRKPTVEVTPPPLYDEVALDEDGYSNRRRSPSPYEDPTTLHLTGPTPLRPMPDFFTTLNQSLIPNNTYNDEGAIYVLTGGRGLIDLQPGKRRSVHYMALSGDASTANESCIIAYELKH